MKKIPDENGFDFDVIVCGGGPSGVASAIAAARRGMRTLLVERYGFCGGMATAGLVNPWSGHEYPGAHSVKKGSIIGGIFKEVSTLLAEGGGFGSRLTTYAFDDEYLKGVYDRMLAEAGVIVRFHSYLSGARVERGYIKSVHVLSKNGTTAFSARTFIDCSGDGDLAALAGCKFDIGRPEDNLTQAMTTSFRMANVDKEAMYRCETHREARALVEPYFQKALASGELHYPYRNFVHFYDYPRAGVLHFNMTRVSEASGLSPEDLSRAEMEGRRQAFLLAGWLIKNVPCFSHAHLEKVACQVGVRETRHIHGLYTITQQDIVDGRKFEDGVARSTYFIDIHNPKGAQDVHQAVGGRGAVRGGFAPPPGDWYEVPFRCLVTRDCSNLVVPCRALSATHEASAAVRVMATMHALGEAAGIASSEAVRTGGDVVGIPGKWVRAQMPWMETAPEYGAPWNSASLMMGAAEGTATR
ncbi:FAD-dependent oxidoreductase [Termitidicoccus mucosus]|uniref:FAD-dependent oxidoreductase n=1 Tax=Termitidicoccus mucosus TaxID=1184151 RepID=A0A178IJ41_9BACT|nr:FAD-dependent oxidoreductase [Opitutaceae bacterium TSB47]